MQIEYDINSFEWSQQANTFYGDAGYIHAIGQAHSSAEPFPSGKRQFNIRNQETGGFRRFRFVREMVVNEPDWTFTEWLFQSEDEQPISCILYVDTHIYLRED